MECSTINKKEPQLSNHSDVRIKYHKLITHHSRNKSRDCVLDRKYIEECHRHDFLVRYIRMDLTFSNFLNFYSSLGIDHDPPCFLCSHNLCLFPFLMFHSSHDHVAKRSHYRIMIFFDFGVLLIYRRIYTLISFYLLHDPTTPILPVYVDQRRPHLEKDATQTRGMIIWKIPTVPRRTPVGPH